jgi:hypothetical protein
MNQGSGLLISYLAVQRVPKDVFSTVNAKKDVLELCLDASAGRILEAFFKVIAWQ